MSIPGTNLRLLLAVVFLIVVGRVSAQNISTSGMVPGHMKKPPVDVTRVQLFTSGTVLEVRPNVPYSGTSTPLASFLTGNASTTTGTGGTIFGLQTVPTFVGAFAPENTQSPSLGMVFPFIMMGKDPLAGGTTKIPAKATEVSLQLLNADGSTFATVPFSTTFDDVLTDSPNFASALIYNSSTTSTQLADAIQRAEFFHNMNTSWHTKLVGPTIVSHVTWTIPFQVDVKFADGTIKPVRSYFTGTASDGNTYVLLLNLLFNADFDNAVVNDINLGNFTTDALNMDWLPNTFLFSPNEANPNVPGSCCVLGYHTYFYAPGSVPQPRWLTLFSSYISPGLFGGGFQDVTALSHEISETFDDPFLSNATPVWQFPGQPSGSTVCQGNLETGDPIEVLANATVAITLTEGTKTLTFHPQTETLLQWFEMGATSDAVDGAFSYPDETALTTSAKACGT